ncbi:MAG: hypothetical protein KGD57_01805 [Candidatus Lokiarchaeota archaeon]|nr:hypothetical protein [Candidatus Lokiarchaeota archaeon]
MDFNKDFIKIEDSSKYLKVFIEKFVDKSSLDKNILFWNSLNVEVKVLDLSELKNLKVNRKEEVLLYDERERNLYEIKYGLFLKHYKKLKYWEEPDHDYIIMNKGLDWFIAITHEDFLLVYGLFTT